MKKIISVLVLGCASLQPLYAEEKSDNSQQAPAQTQQNSAAPQTSAPVGLDAQIANYTQAIKTNPDDADAYFNRGSIYYQKQQQAQALADLQKAIALRPMFANAYGGLCYILLRQGQFINASLYCQKSYELDKSSFALVFNLGHSYLLRGDTKTAHQYYQEALFLIPNPDQQSFAQGPLADFDLFIKNGWQAEAAKAEKQWLQENFAKIQPQIEKINELYNQARIYFNKKEFKQVDNLLTAALNLRKQTDKNNFGVAINLFYLAQSYEQQFKFTEAESLYQQSLAIYEKGLGQYHPAVANGLNYLAILYKTQSKYSEAEPLYLRCLAINEKIFGPVHPIVASSLLNLAQLYTSQGQYAKAEPLLQRSLAIKEKSLGQNHPDVANSLDSLAVLYDSQGQYAKAEPLYQRSLAIWEKTLGKEHPNVATSLSNLATLYQSQGKYAEAEPLLNRSLEIREKSLGKEHPDVANSLNNLALLYFLQSRYTEAEPFYIRSMAIWEKTLGKEHPNVATSLSNLAQIYQAQGKYAEAESHLNRSLEIREKVLGKEHPDVSFSLNNLASLYIAQGHYSEAEPLLSRSLIILEKSLGKEHPEVAKRLNNLAELYKMQGKYAKAEALYQRSLATWEKALGKEHPDVALSLNNLAGLYQMQGRYAEAEQYLNRSLAIKEKILGKEHPDFARGLNDLAQIYYSQARYAEAEPLYQRSLAIWEKTLGKEHPNVAMSLNNLAQIYQAQGKYAEAESYLNRSLEIKEKVLGKDHPDVAPSLYNLAIIYGSQQQYDKAESSLQRSLAIWEKSLGKTHPRLTDGLNILALSYIVQGQYVKAEPLFQKSLRIKNDLLNNWLWGADEKTRQAYLQQEEGVHNLYLSFYSLQNTPEEALYFSLSRKGLLLRIASEMNTLAKQSANPEIQQQVAEFNALKAQLASLAFSGKTDKKDEIAALEEKSNTLERELAQKVSAFKRSKTEVTPQEVLDKLKPEQALVDFLVFTEVDFKARKIKAEQVIALVANKQNGIKLVKLGEFAPIKAAIETYRKEIIPNPQQRSAAGRQKLLSKTAQTLYQLLWQPLSANLQAKTDVYIVPDGLLNLLPFKALQDADGSYLGDKVHLINLSSARDIVLPPIEGQQSEVAIFAGPDYGKVEANKANERNTEQSLSQLSVAELPGALKEGQQLNQMFQENKIPVRLETQKQATEKKLTMLQAPKILHLATHGFFVEEEQKPIETDLIADMQRGIELDKLSNVMVENPLTRSGLTFADANLGFKGKTQQDGTDGILTALEVLALRLEGTDLVTMSACETGVGEIKTGEGVYSLNRAFQEAGAKAVLSTLWPVDDTATSLFMQKFYTRFLNGTPAQEALQQTQQEFMRDKTYNDPVFWAAFVITGKE